MTRARRRAATSPSPSTRSTARRTSTSTSRSARSSASTRPRTTPSASFLRPGRDLLAAGYVIYGPQTALVASFGDGRRSSSSSTAPRASSASPRRAIAVPKCSSEYAINASNYRHWPQPIRAYIDDCLAGCDGPHDCDFNMRWIASLVAEVHRIVTRGGVFLYPSDRAARLRARPAAPGLRMRADRLPDRAGRRQGHRRLRPAARPAGGEPARAHALRLRLGREGRPRRRLPRPAATPRPRRSSASAACSGEGRR